MSVEITTVAIDTLPAKQLNSLENSDQQTINKSAQGNAANKLVEAKESVDIEGLNNLRKNEAQDESREMSRPQLEKVAEQLHEFIGQMNRGLEFSVDKDSGRDVIKVLDKTSGELIKQYPTEEVLSLVAKLSEATGNFVDSKV